MRSSSFHTVFKSLPVVGLFALASLQAQGQSARELLKKDAAFVVLERQVNACEFVRALKGASPFQ